MTTVRTRLRLPQFQLEFEGSIACFERTVEPLLARWSGAPALSGASTRAGEASSASVPPPAPPAATGTSATEASAPLRVTAPAVARGYRPPPGEFGPFVQRLGPEAGEPDRQILAFAFFLWNYEKRDVIREDEVEGCFRALGLAPPSNAADLYESLAGRMRFLLPGPSPLTWVLTTKGANYVKTRLLGGA